MRIGATQYNHWTLENIYFLCLPCVKYRHIVWIYNMYICHFRKQREKRDFDKSFWPVSQRVQIKFISPTMFLYCVYHVMSKSTKQLQMLIISRKNKHRSIVFKCFSTLLFCQLRNGNIRNCLFSQVSKFHLILAF